MHDMNLIIANNIRMCLKEQGVTFEELAEQTDISLSEIRKILTGSQSINAHQLSRITECLNVTTAELSKIPEKETSQDLTVLFAERIASESGRRALEIADEVSDLIIFHRKVRKNGTRMLEPLECKKR